MCVHSYNLLQWVFQNECKFKVSQAKGHKELQAKVKVISVKI